MRREISDAGSDDRGLTIDDSQPQSSIVNRQSSMDMWERQQVFREMVVQQLRNGPLSRIRRRRIVQFAAKLGISAVLAGRLVQQAQRLHETEHRNLNVQSRTSTVEGRNSPVFDFRPSTFDFRPRTIVAIIVGLVLVNSWLILRLLG